MALLEAEFARGPQRMEDITVEVDGATISSIAKWQRCEVKDILALNEATYPQLDRRSRLEKGLTLVSVF